MSWTWRKPRVPVEPGWRAPHDLVNEHAARGVEIAKLNGQLTQTEHMLGASRAEVRNLNARVLELEGRIECQADHHETDRAEWEQTKRQLSGQVAELEQQLVKADAENAALRRQIVDDDNTAVRESAKPQCPEGLLLDGVELHRCVRDGGHDGNHWDRGHEREWPRIAVKDCEVPW